LSSPTTTIIAFDKKIQKSELSQNTSLVEQQS